MSILNTSNSHILPWRILNEYASRDARSASYGFVVSYGFVMSHASLLCIVSRECRTGWAGGGPERAVGFKQMKKADTSRVTDNEVNYT